MQKKQKILLLDNYDSFTFNIAQLLDNLEIYYEIIKNDQLKLKDVEKFDKIILGPGPGLPSEAGQMPDIIKKYYNKIPILGICLGMQAIAEFFGAELRNLQTVFHGIRKKIFIKKDSILFRNLEKIQHIGLYHSWAVSENNFPQDMTITSISEDKIIMSIEHKKYPVFGIQFHPESYITENGLQMVKNFCYFS